MDISFSDDSSFAIVCPLGYPYGKDLLFDVRTTNERLKRDWLPKIKSYTVENRGQIKLPAVLSKCVEYHRLFSGGASSSNSVQVSPPQQDSDFEDDPCGAGAGSGHSSDGDMEDLIYGDDNFTTEWDIKMDFLKKRWLAKEKEMRTQLASEDKLKTLEMPSSSSGSLLATAAASSPPLLPTAAKIPLKPTSLDTSGPVSTKRGIKLSGKNFPQKLTLSDHEDGGTPETALLMDDYSLTYQLLEDNEEPPWMAFSKKTKFDDKGTIPKAGQQIFEHESAAFQILSNEMIALLKAAKNESSHGGQCQFSCEAIDDSLYHWRVRVGGFPSDHPLHYELTVLKSKFGYDAIELQLDFVPEFPFYPPLLRLVRPRLKGCLVQSLANIDILKLTFWNSAKSVHDVLKQIKDILLKHARLDVDNERNDTEKYPEGAYLPLEDFLIKLALSTEVRPRANIDVIAVENLEKAPQLRTKPQPVSWPKSTGGWRAGIGYGSGNRSSGWNPEAYVIAQQEKDRQILEILNLITKEFRCSLAACTGHKASEVYAVVEGSCLLPFLEQQLSEGSFIEIDRHLELYQLLLDVVEAISSVPYLLPLLCNVPRQKLCIMAHLTNLKTSASQYVDYMKTRNRAKKPNSDSGKAKQAKDTKAKVNEDEAEKAAKEDQELANATKIVSLFSKLTDALTAAKLSYSVDEQHVNEKDLAAADAKMRADESLVQRYVRLLKPQQFVSTNFSMTGQSAHKYAKNAEEKLSKEIRTIWKEWTALKTSLPINLESSVYVRVDESRMNLLQALITGPEDTPYANGCFFFDVCFPLNYPSKPPLVSLRTTGGGRVRFNPNLYNCGKVCLSLLGTWSGDSGENWNAKTSTLLQVLVSIQSLILVEEPYFNEPGYERTIGTEEGKKSSEKYNKDVRANCVRYAMLEQLQLPPPGFEDIVRLHYQIKKEIVIKQLDEWLRLDPGNKPLKADVDKMKKLLGELPPLE